MASSAADTIAQAPRCVHCGSIQVIWGHTHCTQCEAAMEISTPIVTNNPFASVSGEPSSFSQSAHVPMSVDSSGSPPISEASGSTAIPGGLPAGIFPPPVPGFHSATQPPVMSPPPMPQSTPHIFGPGGLATPIFPSTSLAPQGSPIPVFGPSSIASPSIAAPPSPAVPLSGFPPPATAFTMPGAPTPLGASIPAQTSPSLQQTSPMSGSIPLERLHGPQSMPQRYRQPSPAHSRRSPSWNRSRSNWNWSNEDSNANED